MKTLIVNRNLIVSMFVVMLLTYGIQGMSYAQDDVLPGGEGTLFDVGETLVVTPGETNTSLKVSFIDRFFEPNKRAYQVQIRRKDPQGDWILKCDTIKGWIVPRPSFDEYLSIIFTDLEPGTTYEARWRETNEGACRDNPVAPDEWSSIREGTTLLETPPRAEFSDTTLAIAVRLTLGLDILDGVEILKIPEEQLTQLTTLWFVNEPMNRFLPEELDLPAITNLTGLEHATKLRTLRFPYQRISDISPLAELTELTELYLRGNQISDISPLAELTELRELDLGGDDFGKNEISDISPLAELTKLRELDLNGNRISDITALAQLTELTSLKLFGNRIGDITPLAQLTELTSLFLGGNRIVDITPLAQLTELTSLSLGGNRIVDIAPLAQLTELAGLSLGGNRIVDITPLAQLTQLTSLVLTYSGISDVKPLIPLTELTSLQLGWNQITDITALAQLQKLTDLHLENNRISDVTPFVQLSKSLETLWLNDNLIRDVTPLANMIRLEWLGLRGNPIEDTSPLSALLDTNPDIYIDVKVIKIIDEALTITASTLQPLTADTLNGSVVTLTLSSGDFIAGIQDELTLSGVTGISVDRTNYAGEGKITVELKFEGNVEKDAILTFTLDTDAIEGYTGPQLTAELPVTVSTTTETPTITETTVSIIPATIASPAIGQQLGFSHNIANGEAIAAYQATVQFDGTTLRYISSAIGDYLPAGAFPLPVDASGNTVTLGGVSLAGESNGDGTLATITFEVIEVKKSTVTLSDVLLSDSAETASRPQVEDAQIIEPPQVNEDVNGDGDVNILDLVRVAGQLGQSGQNSADVNGDGIVNILDLVAVAAALGNAAAAPSAWYRDLEIAPTRADVGEWLVQAQGLDLTGATSQRGVLFLEQLLAVLTPKETMLLPNYPNPFNPETWIPYQLAATSEATITIYDMNGGVVRRLEMGYQAAGIYQSRNRAAYWDGRNGHGESVASGVYFYTLTAGRFSATRRMIILK